MNESMARCFLSVHRLMTCSHQDSHQGEVEEQPARGEYLLLPPVCRVLEVILL